MAARDVMGAFKTPSCRGKEQEAALDPHMILPIAGPRRSEPLPLFPLGSRGANVFERRAGFSM